MKEFSQFVESLQRLYRNQQISKSKIIELYNDFKINKEEMDYILK